MKRTICFALATILVSSLVLAACGKDSQNKETAKAQSADTYSFKLTHITQPSHVWNKTAEKFNEELKARSNGRMKVDIFPAAQLGPEQDMVQQLETGTLDFAIITNAYMSTRSQAFNAWSLPFLFKNLEEATEASKTEPAKKILSELDKNGIIGMNYLSTGMRHILMKGKSITKPEDLKGKKIRVLGSPSILDFWKAVGAGPAAMPLPEVYTSMQTGLIDGIDIDLDALYSQKYYEIAKNLTLTNHFAFPGIVVMSKAVREKMPPEDQKIVTEAMNAAVDWGNKEAISREKTNLEDIKAKGVTVTELTNTSSFNAARDEMYEKYSSNSLIKDFIHAYKK